MLYDNEENENYISHKRAFTTDAKGRLIDVMNNRLSINKYINKSHFQDGMENLSERKLCAICKVLIYLSFHKSCNLLHNQKIHWRNANGKQIKIKHLSSTKIPQIIVHKEIQFHEKLTKNNENCVQINGKLYVINLCC